MTDLPSLHSIADAIIQAAQVNEDGELLPEAEAKLEALNLTLAQKVEAYHLVILKLKALAEANRTVASPFLDKATSFDVSAKRLHERLYSELTRLGAKKVETTTIAACIEKSPDRVVLVEGAPIPPEYLTRPEPKPSLTKIAQTLKCGVALPFATLEQGSHLRFR
jgi:hypothetical protein